MLSLDNDQQKVSSIVHPHHVIRVTELLEQSLIQSLLLTHHCYCQSWAVASYCSELIFQ